MNTGFTVGGTISGLEGLAVLLESAGEQLVASSDGVFRFSGELEEGTAYDVRVLAQPTLPTQVCDVLDGAGVVEAADIDAVRVDCETSSFLVGGTVSGLLGAGLVLENGQETVSIVSDGSFTYPTPVRSGNAFETVITGQPEDPTQSCAIANGSGIVGATDVLNITVSCETDAFTVGGTISGLADAVVLVNSNAEELTVGTDGAFAFVTPVLSGESFDVTVAAHPSQTCSVASGSGVVVDSNVTTIAVTCTRARFTVGGTVTGLADGESVTLRLIDTFDLVVASNGLFSFAEMLASSDAYAVKVVSATSPKLCDIRRWRGVMGATDVEDIAVSCSLPLCGTTLVDETALRGIPSDASGGGALWFDVEQDGDPDLFVRSVGLFINDGSGYFTEETVGRGLSATLGHPDWPKTTAVGDLDSDGDIDLFVGNDTRYGTIHNQLFLNDGTGWFTDIAQDAGLVLATNTPGAAVFFDHDADGDVDLTYVSEFNPPGMFRNDGTFPFGRDESKFSNVLQGDAAAWADYDADGDQDLFMPTGSYVYRNRLFRNDGGSWVDDAAAAGIAGSDTGRWGGVSWVDLDRDGDLDATISRDGSANDFVYFNDGTGAFAEVSSSSIGLPDAYYSMGNAPWTDLDRDGDMDVARFDSPVATSAVFLNDGDGFFSRHASAIVRGFVGAWADINRDGIPDLYVSTAPGSTNDRLYLGTSVGTGCTEPRSMRVRVVTDRDGNAEDGNHADDRDALGARLDVDLDGDGEFTSASYLIGSAQCGSHAQSELAPTVGFGAHIVTDLRVTFIDGSVVTLHDAPVTDFLVIRDPG